MSRTTQPVSARDNEPVFEEIAIVGMSCRWPGGATSPAHFWELLTEGRDGQCEVPEWKYNVEAFHHPSVQKRGTIISKSGYFLRDDPRSFDHTFFGLSAMEAKSMDPQQRQLLEIAYECLESAGVTLEKASGSSTACFVGNFTSDYARIRERDPEANPPYALTGESITMLSNRLSYIFNLKGPSMTIDTACSSAIYALNMACNSIQSGEASAAIVGGVNLILTPDQTISSTKLGVLSPTSKCHTFDESADGYARAEGVAALYVKKLSDAIRDGDPIRGVIKATAVNANGKTAGITQPNASSQEAVIRQAYKRAGGLDLKDTTYFECHGTGTPVGDPVEVEAVSRVFAPAQAEGDTLLIGSVKTNLGHSEAASGLASIIKVVQALDHGIIPATIGITRPNPKIHFDDLKVKVVTESTKWPVGKSGIRRASVNSFGFGGANAHVILESAPREPAPAPEPAAPEQSTMARRNSYRDTLSKVVKKAIHIRRNSRQTEAMPEINEEIISPYLMLFSAQSAHSVESMATSTIGALEGRPEKVPDVAHLLSSRRSRFPQRGFFVCDQTSFTDGKISDKLAIKYGSVAAPPRIAFVFTGQGAQWCAMGSSLIKTVPSFRATIRLLDQYLRRLEVAPTWTIEESLLSPETDVNQVDLSQTLCTAVQVAVVDLLAEWNIKPVSTVGHSSGEIAAAYAAGRSTKAGAIIAAYLRGHSVKQSKSDGAMLAVGVGKSEIEVYISSWKNDITIACVNAPNSVTLSGSYVCIEAVKAALDDAKIFCRILRTNGRAYHSPQMQEIGGAYEDALRSSQGKADAGEREIDAQAVKMFSSVTGKQVEGSTMAPAYWRENLESPVLFSTAAAEMLRDAHSNGLYITHLVEVGPHSALEGPIKSICKSLDIPGQVQYLSTLRRNESCVHNLYNLAGMLFSTGHDVKISKLNQVVKPPAGQALKEALDILPTYPWDHNGGILWEESRISREWRFRKSPSHDLLGTRVPESVKNCLMWRNVLKLEDAPWLEGHKLMDDVVFPAAGYLAVVMEAISQTVPDASTSAYIFRNVAFKRALVIPKDNIPIEIVAQLYLGSETKDKSVAFKFTVSSIIMDIQSEHCSGTIIARPNTQSKPSNDRWSTSVMNAGSTRAWFEAFSKVGLVYGPDFQLLEDIRTNPRVSLASADVRLPLYEGQSSYRIYPAVLDACLQAALISAASGRIEKLTKGYVPVFADEIAVFPKQPQNEPSQAKIRSWLAGKGSGLRHIHAGCELRDLDDQLMVQISGLDCVLYEGVSQGPQVAPPRDPYLRTIWKPDIDMLPASRALEMFPPRTFYSLVDTLEKLNRLCSLCILQTESKKVLIPTDTPKMPHLTAFLDWVGRNADSLRGTYSDNLDKDAEIALLAEQLREVAFESQVVKAIYDNISQIISGVSSSVEVLLRENALSRLYEVGIGSAGAYAQMNRIVDLIAHKRPRMKVLELGAGTGGATRALLKTLGATESLRRYSQYTYTDISPSFLSGAQKEFKDCRSFEFRTLDIENDPLAQGFELEEYDLILAANVVHASKNIDKSLRNAHSLLKPGGKLVLLEVTRDHVLPGFMLGTFPGYWQDYEDGRSATPFLTKPQWHDRLNAAGFAGLDISLDDYPEEHRLTSLLLSSKPYPEKKPEQAQKLALVYRKEPTPLAKEVEKIALESGYLVQGLSLADLLKPYPTERFENALCCVEGEDESLISDMNEQELSAVQALAQKASTIFWLTRGGLMTGLDPRRSMMAGVARAIMSEQPSTRIRSIDFDTQSPAAVAHVMGLVLEVVAHPERQADHEFTIKDGVRHVSRLSPDRDLNNTFRRWLSKNTEPTRTVLSPDNPLRMDMERFHPGLLDTLAFTTDSRAGTPLGPDEVEVKVAMLGMNMKDIVICMGNIDHKAFGQEFVGTVSRVGTSVSNVAPGDRVLAFAEGHFNTYHRTSSILCRKLKDNEDMEDLATLLIAYTTALYGIQTVARLQEDESVLIHSAAGGVGIACIEVAQHIGAKIYATVGSPEKKEFLIKTYGIPAENIFHSRSVGFAKELMTATEGKGIDVAISSVTGTLLEETWRCMASFGRFVDIGRKDIYEHANLDMSMFEGCTTFNSFDLMQVFREKPRILSKLIDETLELYRAGRIHAVKPIQKYDISDLQDAMRQFMKGVHIGKVVIEYKDNHSVLTVNPPKTTLQLKPDVTYLIVGGLGGLGRSLALWMIERGARDFLFLSRSGADKPDAARLVEELQNSDASVTVVKGDVSVKADVENAISQAKFPIRGVVQAAMVLQDGLFASQTVGAFQRSLKPKVEGTINLHECLLHEPLDFFLMTSSLSGTLGTVTQSNYCAANSFLDSFGRYRHRLGLPATSLALGMVTGVGYVAENPEVEKALVRNGFYGIDEREFLHAVEVSIQQKPNDIADSSTDYAYDPMATSFLLTGLEPIKLIELTQKGFDGGTFWNRDVRLANILGALEDTDAQASRAIAGHSNAYERTAGAWESSPEAFKTAVAEVFVERLSGLLLAPPERFTPGKRLAELGLDSMIGAELRNWLFKEFKTDIPFFEILNPAATVGALSERIASVLGQALQESKPAA